MLATKDKDVITAIRHVLVATNQARLLKLERQQETIHQLVGAAVMPHLNDPKLAPQLQQIDPSNAVSNVRARKVCMALGIDSLDLTSLMRRHAAILDEIASISSPRRTKGKQSVTQEAAPSTPPAATTVPQRLPSVARPLSPPRIDETKA